MRTILYFFLLFFVKTLFIRTIIKSFEMLEKIKLITKFGEMVILFFTFFIELTTY